MTTATKLKTATFKLIESELYSYPDTLKEIEQLRKDIIFTRENDDENIGGGRSSLPGRPTERIATRLATNKRLKWLEEIASAIERVYTRLPEERQKLVRLYYWARPQTLTWDGVAAKLYVNKRTAQRWRDDIVHSIAETLGWR